MKVCVFEWIGGGGAKFDQVSLSCPAADCLALLEQGRGMLNAVVEDFASAGHEVHWLRDARLDDNKTIPGTSVAIEDGASLPQILLEIASNCDAILLIAPETGGRLLKVCEWLKDYRDRLISPNHEFVRLTSDKEATCLRLSEAGVAVPTGCRYTQFKEFSQMRDMKYPLVLKPVDGAGSEHIRLIRSLEDLDRINFNADLRIEAFVPGLPASVSVLCYGSENQLLPATGQLFDAEPIGHYVGAKYPLPSQLAERAARLAAQAIQALPRTTGYIGIDLVLSNSSPDQDTVIEINPRLTMSYLTLRQVCGFNIADSMLKGLRAGGNSDWQSSPTFAPNS